MSTVRTFIAFALPLACAIAGSAESAEKSAPNIVGTWRIVDFTQVVVETNEITRPMGEKLLGFIQYSPGCHMITVISRADLPKPATLPYTDAERSAIHKGIVAYAGSYTVEGNKVTHHVLAGWRTDWIGGDQVRFAEVNGNRLLIKAPPVVNNVTGKTAESTLIFERAD